MSSSSTSASASLAVVLAHNLKKVTGDTKVVTTNNLNTAVTTTVASKFLDIISKNKLLERKNSEISSSVTIDTSKLCNDGNNASGKSLVTTATATIEPKLHYKYEHNCNDDDGDNFSANNYYNYGSPSPSTSTALAKFNRIIDKTITSTTTTIPTPFNNFYYNFNYFSRPPMESSLLSSSSIAVSLAGSSIVADTNSPLQLLTPTTRTSINNLLDSSYYLNPSETVDKQQFDTNKILLNNETLNLDINNKHSTVINNRNPLKNDNQIKRNDVHYLLKQLNSFSDIEEIAILDDNNSQIQHKQPEKNSVKNQNITKLNTDNEINQTLNKYQSDLNQIIRKKTLKEQLTSPLNLHQQEEYEEQQQQQQQQQSESSYCHHNTNKTIFEIELNTCGDSIDSNNCWWNNWTSHDIPICSMNRKLYKFHTNQLYNNDDYDESIKLSTCQEKTTTNTTTTTITPNTGGYEYMNKLKAEKETQTTNLPTNIETKIPATTTTTITHTTMTTNFSNSNSIGQFSNSKSLNSSISSTNYHEYRLNSSLKNYCSNSNEFDIINLKRPNSNNSNLSTIHNETSNPNLATTTNVVYSTTTRMSGDIIHTEINRDNYNDGCIKKYTKQSTIAIAATNNQKNIGIQCNISSSNNPVIVNTTLGGVQEKESITNLAASSAIVITSSNSFSNNSQHDKTSSSFFKCCYTSLDRWRREKRNDKSGNISSKGGGLRGCSNGTGGDSMHSSIYAPVNSSNKNTNKNHGDPV